MNTGKAWHGIEQLRGNGLHECMHFIAHVDPPSKGWRRENGITGAVKLNCQYFHWVECSMEN